MYADLDELEGISVILKQEFENNVELERQKVIHLNEVVKHSNAVYDIETTTFELNNVLIPIVYNNLTTLIEKCLDEWAFVLGVKIKLKELRGRGPYLQIKFLRMLTLLDDNTSVKNFKSYKEWNVIRNKIVHERSNFIHSDKKILNKKGIEYSLKGLKVREESLLFMIGEIETYFNELYQIIYNKTIDE